MRRFQIWMGASMKNLYLGLFLNLAFGVGIANAVTNTWIGAANGDWFSTNNWTMLAVPADGDTVMITNSAVLLTNSTAMLERVVVANATVTFTNWTTALKAKNVTLCNLGRLTCAGCNTNGAPGNTNRVYVLCSNMTVEVGGSVFADGLGYAGGQAVNTKGQGPGGGFYSSSYGGGGGYGGAGGNGYGGAGGPAYSTETDAMQPGSGGGRGASITPGNGGGAVWIEATGTLTLGGSITANGADGYHGGSGSGGGIAIQCGIFESSVGSSITADGGTCTVNGGGGGGGGGRIMVSYMQTTPGSIVYLSADYGVRASGTVSGFPGELGSIKVSDAALLAGSVRMNGAVYGVTEWNADSLRLTNSHLVFRTPGLAFRVTNNVVLDDSTLDIDLSNAVFRVDGQLILTNAATLILRSGPTNAVGIFTNYGGLLSVGGAVMIGPGCTNSLVSMRDDSGVLKCEVGSMVIAAGGSVNSDYFGYIGATNVNTAGRGPGGGGAGGAGYGGGGGYGGKGGNAASVGLGGEVYGDSNAPVRCGSGGGSRTAVANSTWYS